MSTAEKDLRDVVGRLVKARGCPATIEESLRLWDEMVSLGLRDIGVPDGAGGSGGDLADLVVLVEALAEAAVSVPIVEASVGRWAFAAASGDLTGTVSVCFAPDKPAPHRSDLEIIVPWGRVATIILVCTSADVRLVSPADTMSARDNVAGEPYDILRLPPQQLLDAAVLSVPVAAVRSRLVLLRSASLLGAARGAFRLTRSYTRQRHQFGAPLVDLPAVATGLAQMRVQLVQAEAAVARAVAMEAGTAPSDGLRTETAATVSLWASTTAATEVARLAHQLHGAIGITDEYPLHRLTRRIWAWRDHPQISHETIQHLGDIALRQGESSVWTAHTAWHPLEPQQPQTDHVTIRG